MQKEEEREKQTKINAGAVKNNDCMDVDFVFSKNTMHSWGIHGNGIYTMQTEEEPGKDSNKRKEKKKFKTFFATVSAIKFMLQTVQIFTLSMNQQATPIGI